MGLDMYLSAKLWTSKYGNEKLNKKFWACVPFKPIDNINSAELKVEVGYWRKSNHIHKWFVDNCQEGEDDCRYSYVSRKQLKELLELCKKVLKDKSKAKELLPVEKGFFFGSSEYDDWYFDDIKDTIDQIERVLKDVPEEWDFEYHASW